MSASKRTQFAFGLTAPGRIIERLSSGQDEAHRPLNEADVLADVRRIANRSKMRISRVPDLLSRAGFLPDATAAAMAILLRWDAFTQSGRRLIATSIPEPISNALRLLATGSLKQFPDAGFRDVIRHLPDSNQLPLLDEWIQSDRDVVRQAAVSVIRELGQQNRRRNEPTVLDSLVERLLLSGPDLRYRDALQGVLPWLPHSNSRFSTFHSDPEHPTHLLLRGIIRSNADELSGRELFELLSVATVAPAARDAIAKLIGNKGIATLAESSHLLLAPSRRAALKGVLGKLSHRNARQSGWLQLAMTTNDARLIQATGAFQDSKAKVDLSPFVASSDPRIRASLVVQIGGGPVLPQHVVDALRDLSFDSHPSIARRALMLLESSLGPRTVVMSRGHRRSPHAVCRELARDASLDVFQDDQVPALAAEGQSVQMRRRLAEHRDRCVASIRRAISVGETTSRITAMRWARRLDIAGECELELLAALAGEEHRVSATAATALAAVHSDSATQALMSSLHHEDSRTRANAIEALARCSELSRVDLDRHCNRSPRESANIARACLVATDDKALVDRGGQILEGMLQDHCPGRRISGLWVAERLGRTESAQQVARIASHDEDATVRKKARRSARRLLAELQCSVAVRMTAAMS